MGCDFFVSYTHVDRGWAEWVAWQLEAAGYTTVLQAWDFTPGSDWVHEMQTTMGDARRTLAVLSAAYLGSVHGEAEWRGAYAADPTGEQGLLVPVRVQHCDPSGLLGTRVYIDLVGLDEAGARAALLDGVLERRAKPTVEPGFPGRAVPDFPAPAAHAQERKRPDVRSQEDDRAHLEKLLAVHKRNVRILETQEASYAGAMPVHLAGQLEQEREAVTELRRRLGER